MADRPRHLVDFHAHVFPEKVVDRALAALTEAYQVRPVARPTIAGLVGRMDETGVDVSVVLPVATRPDQVSSINDWAAENRSHRVVCFGALHPDLADPAAEVERMVSLGLKGLKLQPQFQSFHPDEPRLWPLYQAVEGRLTLVFHGGQEIVPVPHVYARPSCLGVVHRAFPRLTMVVAHMGGYRMWEEAREHLIGEDVYIETSYCPDPDLPDAELVALLRGHGVERTLFGTDFPWGDATADLARLLRIGLTQEQVEAIAWRNANVMLNLGLE